MNLVHHKNLPPEKWFAYSLNEQLANVGSEVERTINWKSKDTKLANSAFERMLELLDLTLEDAKNKSKLKELCRLREVLVDYLWGENEYQSSKENTLKYFYFFNYLARTASVTR